MKILLFLCRLFVGVLFLISGFVKVIDPKGTAIKLEEYFDIFAQDFAPFFAYFIPAALFFSYAMIVLELVIGVALLINYKMKVTTWALLILIVTFTFLTFYSYHFNVVTDCGCFGDAIKLTPKESFYKDIILLIPTLLLFVYRKKMYPLFVDKLGHTVIFVSFVGFALFANYNVSHLPVIDFRAYKIGTDLAKEKIGTPPVTAYFFTNKKTKEEKSFTEWPQLDSTWEYKDFKEIEPYKPAPLEEFVLKDPTGTDYTEELLNEEQVLLATLTKATDHSSIKEIDKLLLEAAKKSMKTVYVYSFGEEEFQSFQTTHLLSYDLALQLDATVSKAMIRSNPGLVYLEKGIVKGKWHRNHLPNNISEITTSK